MKNYTKGSLLVIFSTLAYGSLPVISKLAFEEGMNVTALLFFRFFIGSILIWSYLLIRKIDYKTTKSHLMYLFTLGVMGFLGTSSFIYMAYTYISGSLATIILFTHPIMIACYEIFIMKERKDSKKIIALICASIGLIFVVGDQNVHLNIFGVMFSLLSALCYSYYAIGLTEKRTKKMNSIVISAYISASCTVTYFIYGGITHKLIMPKSLMAWGCIGIQAVFCTMLATIAFCSGVKRIGASTAVIISTFEPVVACLTGFFILGEVLTLQMILGGIGILFAIIILQMPYSKSLLKNKMKKEKG